MQTSNTTPPVQIAVITTRSDQTDGIRQAITQGPFDDAVREALQARLAPWAADQVLASVLSRRPPAGQAAEYEGSFSPVRHIRVVVRPVGSPADESPVSRTRRLGGLFLPEVSQHSDDEHDGAVGEIA